EKMEVAPGHVVDELAHHHLRGHRLHAQRLILAQDESSRYDLKAMPLDRPVSHAALLRPGQGPCLCPLVLGQADHEGDVRAVQVGVEQSHLVPSLDQCQGQVEADCRLADASLAAPDRDDVLHDGVVTTNLKFERCTVRAMACSGGSPLTGWASIRS